MQAIPINGDTKKRFETQSRLFNVGDLDRLRSLPTNYDFSMWRSGLQDRAASSALSFNSR